MKQSGKIQIEVDYEITYDADNNSFTATFSHWDLSGEMTLESMDEDRLKDEIESLDKTDSQFEVETPVVPTSVKEDEVVTDKPLWRFSELHEASKARKVEPTPEPKIDVNRYFYTSPPPAKTEPAPVITPPPPPPPAPEPTKVPERAMEVHQDALQESLQSLIGNAARLIHAAQRFKKKTGRS